MKVYYWSYNTTSLNNNGVSPLKMGTPTNNGVRPLLHTNSLPRDPLD